MNASARRKFSRCFAVASAWLTIVVLALPDAATAAVVIYEPFDDSETTLTGNTPGTGLTGTWATSEGVTWTVGSPSLVFGSLPNSGNKATAGAGRGGNSITDGTVAANTLKTAGRLEHGATVWFSFLWKMDDAAVSNGDAAFSFGTDGLTGANGTGMNSSGNGIGVSISTSSGNLSAAIWVSGTKSTGTAPAWGTRTVPKLVVGKIVWGSDGTQNDTVNIYTPGTDLALPASVSSITAVLDQSQFDTICFATKNEGDPQIDEIRFGATYLDVIAAAPTAAYWDLDGTTAGSGSDDTPDGTWNTGNLWNPVADGTGTAAAWTGGQTAVFAAGTDATGTYGVTVDSTKQIGGLTFEEGTVTLSGGTALELPSTGGAIDVRLPSATATVSTPLTQSSLGGNLYKDGSGTLTLSGNNTYDCPTIVAAGKLILSGDNSGAVGNMTLVGGVTQFDSTLAIPGSGRSVTLGTGAVAMFGSALDNTAIAAGLLRIATASPGIIAADNNAGDNFDMNTAGLTAAYFGAVGNVTYTGTLTPNGNYRLGGAGGTLTLSADNAITGASKTLTVNGPGTVILSGTTSYTGLTTINSGATLVKLGSSSATTTTLNKDGTFIVGNSNATGGNGFTSAVFGNLILASDLNIGGNSFFFSTGASIRSDGTTARTFAGKLSGNANNAIILGDRVNNGKLTFTTTAPALSSLATVFTCNSDVEFTLGFASSTLGPTKQGPGTMTLSGANLFTGAISINQGTVKVDAGAGGSLNGTTGTALTFSYTGTGSSGGQSGGVFNYDNTTATGPKSQGMGALTLSAGECTVQATRTAAQTVSLTFASLAARPAGASGNFVVSLNGGVNGTDNKISFTTPPTAGALIDKGIFFGGSSFAAYASGGFVRGLNYASSGGDTGTVDADTITASSHVKLTTTPANQNSITLLSLNLAASGVNWPQNASQTLTCPAILKAGGGSSTISGGTAVTGGTGIELVIRTDTSSDQLTISTPVTGTGALTKSGAGTLILDGLETYSGATKVNAGTLLINNTGNTGNSAVTVASGATLGGAGKVVGAVTVNSDGIIQPSISGSANTLTLSSATAPTLNTGSMLKIRAPSATMDKLSSSATRLIITGTDLIIDVTGLSGNVASATIVQLTGSDPGITGPFRSVTVVGNAYYVATLDYSTAGQVKLALVSNEPPRGTLFMVK